MSAAWLSLIRYYGQGFKYGSYPKITSDQIWLWSRPHPKAATPSAPTNPRPDNWDTTEDNLYVLVMLTFASRVVITSGGNTGTWWLQPGVNKLSIASSPGSISARIERNNVRIKAFDSTGQFSYTNTPVDYSER
jgi:glucan endo-1,3-alpha-glucosidase